MKILIVSNIEPSDTNACGNTYGNWLTGWKDAEVSCIYCRDAIPYNEFCNSYYVVSPISIAKNILTPWRIGRYIKRSEIGSHSASSIEARMVKTTKTKNFSLLHVIHDMLVSTCIWQNKRYKNFIQDFNPDVVFTFAKSEAFIYQNLKYIQKYTHAKTILFFADDMYSIYQDNSLIHLIFKHRFPKIATMCDKNYGASVLMCKTYAKQFGISLTPLYKGCVINDVKTHINKPVRIVYAGNLYYGREKTLCTIAKALKKINSNGQIAKLEIYTNAVITPEINALLNIDGSSQIMGCKPFHEIQQIMKESDIVLHVESFDPENIKIVRLSYSTKISDCLQSGAMMIIVGPDGIASVEEGKLIDGVEVVTEERKIELRLREILNNPNSVIDAASRTNGIAREKFPIDVVRKRLHDDFVQLINEN